MRVAPGLGEKVLVAWLCQGKRRWPSVVLILEATVRGRQVALLGHRRRPARRALATARVEAFKGPILLHQRVFLRSAALPAVSPIADQELEAEAFDPEAGLETDAQVFVIHPILVDVCV